MFHTNTILHKFTWSSVFAHPRESGRLLNRNVSFGFKVNVHLPEYTVHKYQIKIKQNSRCPKRLMFLVKGDSMQSKLVKSRAYISARNPKGSKGNHKWKRRANGAGGPGCNLSSTSCQTLDNLGVDMYSMNLQWRVASTRHAWAPKSCMAVLYIYTTYSAFLGSMLLRGTYIWHPSKWTSQVACLLCKCRKAQSGEKMSRNGLCASRFAQSGCHGYINQR